MQSIELYLKGGGWWSEYYQLWSELECQRQQSVALPPPPTSLQAQFLKHLNFIILIEIVIISSAQLL